MMRIFSILIFLILCIPDLFPQEVIVPLGENFDSKQYYSLARGQKKATSQDTVSLPFIDDFSDSDVEPKPTLWSDKRAYINNRYSSDPVTAGIATLDAFDYNGALYQNAGSTPYVADYLTSAPIDLLYQPSDSIYLSFYYEAKGIGEQPDQVDSLCLDFFNVSSESWERAWSTPGKVMNGFEYVSIPFTNADFLKKGFRFRFYNYSTLPQNPDYEDEFSNSDHWHLDYIILDKNRSRNDTTLHDVSLVEAVSSMLNDYESIPWTHLQPAFTTQRSKYITTGITNHDDITRNVSKYMRIVDKKTGVVYNTDALANDFLAGENRLWNFDYDYPFDFSTPSPVKLEISAILKTDAFDYKNNDTLRREQVFDNYYAYDDGSSEYGYGINGNNVQNAMVAVHFETFKADSLRAIDMYFNQVKDSLNLDYYFYLNVWEDNNGIPGNLIYSQLGVRPEYGDGLNSFVRYELDSAIFLNGDYFIGWRKTVNNLINIGFDLNKNNRMNNFYNLGPGWNQSVAEGCIMIRPVMSITPLVTGIMPDREMKDYSLYPNPADQFIRIESGSDYFHARVSVYDISGRQLLETEYYSGDDIYTGSLNPGIYLLSISGDKNFPPVTKKFIIKH